MLKTKVTQINKVSRLILWWLLDNLFLLFLKNLKEPVLKGRIITTTTTIKIIRQIRITYRL